MATTAEQLAQVEAAIAAIETRGQSYTIGDRTFRRGDLGILYAERRKLQAQEAQETRKGIRVRYGTPPA